MTTHTSTKTVRFNRAFTLPGLDRSYPAGDYEVTTDDEQLDLSFSAFRRISTRIALKAGAETRHVEVAPAILQDALAQDVEPVA